MLYEINGVDTEKSITEWGLDRGKSNEQSLVIVFLLIIFGSQLSRVKTSFMFYFAYKKNQPKHAFRVKRELTKYIYGLSSPSRKK